MATTTSFIQAQRTLTNIDLYYPDYSVDRQHHRDFLVQRDSPQRAKWFWIVERF